MIKINKTNEYYTYSIWYENACTFTLLLNNIGRYLPRYVDIFILVEVGIIQFIHTNKRSIGNIVSSSRKKYMFIHLMFS